jgi:hypothetical protein
MAKKKASDPLLEAVQNLLIVQLALAGVDNHSIRRIAAVQMGKVTRILKVLKTHTRQGKNRGPGNG